MPKTSLFPNLMFTLRLLACTFAAIFVMQGSKAYSTLAAKAQAQHAATEKVMRFKESLAKLANVRTHWEKSYAPEERVQDMLTLLALVNFEDYGIETDNDNLLVQKVEAVKLGEVELELSKVCLATGVGDGASLYVRAGNYSALLNGIKQLAKRPDIAIGNIALQGESAFPLAKLGEFCLYLRRS